MAKGKYQEWLTQDGLLLLEGWARDGLSDDQIADNMGIVRSTFYNWMNLYSDIKDAIKRGRRPVSYEVENAFLKSAVGYKVTLKKPVKLRREKQKQGEGKIVEEYIEYVEEEIYVPPQTANQIFYLKNKMPSKYKDKPVESTESSVEKHNALIDAIRNMEDD